MLPTLIALSALGAALVVAVPAVLLGLKIRGRSKGELYELLYAMNWGDTTTNNYGFVPAEGDGPERFQLQMYTELYKLLRSHGDAPLRPQRLLEISCGRGGGLDHFIRHLGDAVPAVHAVGFDLSMNALKFCKGRYADIDFVRGSALQLPFEAASFDVVVNVEASNDYGDDAAFLREVHRVLRPRGLFLYASSQNQRHAGRLERHLRDAGFEGAFRDITENVVLACRMDSARRRHLIRAGVPWYYRVFVRRRLEHYAGIEGSKRFERLRNRRRIYLMACMLKAR